MPCELLTFVAEEILKNGSDHTTLEIDLFSLPDELQPVRGRRNEIRQ